MAKILSFLVICSLVVSGSVFAAAEPEFVDHDEILMDHGDGHMMDMDGGMVMGQNADTLPDSCKKISDEVEITVRAGRKYAEQFPGTLFTFNNQQWRVEPCSKITWHFINEDNIRHQFMMHGLPKYIYKSGMFHLELTGPGKISGTIIVPSNDETYLVHCDISQHMEKGMKGQLVVGNGGVDFPSIPGLTAYAFPDVYEGAGTPTKVQQSPALVKQPKPKPKPKSKPSELTQRAASSASNSLISGMLVIGLALGLLGTPILVRKFKGMAPAEIADYCVDQLTKLYHLLMQGIDWAIRFISSQISKLSA